MPTHHRHFRRIESPQGSGTIQHGGDVLATVTYALRVLQEIIGTRHWSGGSAVKGVRQISGGFAITYGSLPFDGDDLTLRLSDGRQLSIVAIGHGPSYTIETIGDFR